MDPRPPMPAFDYSALGKHLVPFLPSAKPDAYYVRLALQTEDNVAVLNPMTWMLLRNDVFCRSRLTRAVRKAYRDSMSSWCMETIKYIPHAVLLKSIPLSAYPNIFPSADAVAALWYYASRHIEFKNSTDAEVFGSAFGTLVELKDKEDEDRLIHALARAGKLNMTIDV